MRVHELAKKMGMKSAELLKLLKEQGIEAKSHMSNLDDDTCVLIEEEVGKEASVEGGKTGDQDKKPKKTKKKTVKESKETKEKAKKKEDKAEKKKSTEAIQLKFPITVSSFAANLNIKVSELIKKLMGMGIFANVNQLLNEEIAGKVAESLGITVEELPSEEEELVAKHKIVDDPSKLKPRPPIVTLMGHVDHGKTSLLDAIRETNVVARESGKITQHIGAYSVEIPGKGQVTFLDTPGHSAFTAMRARGANVTDVVVLVVAADDGIMPQTTEAIDHSRAAEVPIVVAINKVDLPSANIERVKAGLQKADLTPEEWGGKTICVGVSAKTKKGINELLEMLLLEAEILELKANPDRRAQGVVVESRLTKSHGPVATIIVQNGTLNVGDYVVCGQFYGKIRAMHNDKGKNVKQAGPAAAVQVFGIQGVPDAGDAFYVAEDEKNAKAISDKRKLEIRERKMSDKLRTHVTLESLFDKIKEGEVKELKIILKADTQGSVEAIKDSLEKLSTDKIKLKVIHGGVGGINESDVVLAAASDAIIIGFHVKATSQAVDMIEKEKVDVRYYKIIYEAVQDVRKAMEGLLEPTIKEVIKGTAVIKQVFKSSKAGTIGGAIVKKGHITRSGKARVIRNEIVIYEGRLSSLKRFKDDVTEVAEGYECGISFDKFNDLKEGDIIECFKEEKIATKL